MADTPQRYPRDPKTGRFAVRRPVPDVDAESRFGPMGDSIEDIGNVSSAPSPNTIERPRHAPAGDMLAGPSYPGPLRARNAELVHPDDEGHFNAVLRTAARDSGPLDPTPYLTGVTVRDE